MALLLMPGGAGAASPVLEFVVPGHSLPVGFTTESGVVSAEMAGFAPLVHCTASHGEGKITGPRTTVSEYWLTGCTAGGQKCKSEGAKEEEEIKTRTIDAELVYIDQARREVGMLLNPGGGTYIAFECGGIPAEGQGPFLAPVGPIDQEATSFTATLNQLDSVQTPDEYEDEKGERLQAIPMGSKETNPFVPTGAEAAFTVHPSVPGEIKAISTQEIEAEQHEEQVKTLERDLQQEEVTLKKQEEALKKAEERAKQGGEEAKKREEELKSQIAALKKQLEESKPPTRAQLLARALRACQRQPKKQRARCAASAHRKYGAKAAKTSRH